jgi:lipoate-protein ligase A
VTPVRVEQRRGTAAELHADDWPDDWPDDWDPCGEPSPGTVVRRCEVTAPALVLGSTQDVGVVDVEGARREGIDVVRRRSGGGVVLLLPGECAWIDVYLPSTDARWDDRVDRSFRWAGEVWQAAVAALGVHGRVVPDGRLVADTLGRLVCFAGRGPGEVLVGDRKLVGMSQRRTRRGARVQCLVPRSFDAGSYATLLVPPVDTAELARRVAVLDRPADDVLAAFVTSLAG